MDINTLKSLIAKANELLPTGDANMLRNLVNEVYLQDELKTLYNGMPLHVECEPWRAERIQRINTQLASL